MPSSNYRMTITLKSDLCAASGDGFSSGIDTDICYDSKGFPFIPGKRLKGCLRDAAQTYNFLNDSQINELFGTSGTERGRFFIGNARITGYDNLIAQYPTKEEALNAYTYLKAQTAICEDGHADDETLRFIRVVKQYNPNDTSDELKLEADIELEDESLKPSLEAAVKALRNIGYKRNAGFGAISCKLNENMQTHSFNSGNTESYNAIRYTVKLDGPVMLAQIGNGETIDYIPGSSVMGFFASQLWKKYHDSGTNSAQDDFDNIFFKDKRPDDGPYEDEALKDKQPDDGSHEDEKRFFSPLYPASNKEASIAAPSIIAKIKGGEHDGDHVNTMNYTLGAGETPKPLRDGFIGSKSFEKKKIYTETIYHHSVKNRTLYTQKAISEGQEFAGFIMGDTKFLEEISGVMKESNGILRFGRSKTAQYARCRLADCSFDTIKVGQHPEGKQSNTASNNKKKCIALLDTDSILIDDFGNSTLNKDDLINAISVALFEVEDKIKLDQTSRSSYIQAHPIVGFNAKWNQQKPHVDAFKAGSTLVIDISDEIAIPESGLMAFIGERQIEGFGCVRILPVDAILPPAKEPIQNSDEQNGGGEHDGEEPIPSMEDCRMAAINYAKSCDESLLRNFNPTFLNRVLQMAKESHSLIKFYKQSDANKEPDNRQDRIGSIKDNSKRSAAQNLVEGFLANDTIKVFKPTTQGGWSNGDIPRWDEFKECLLLSLTFMKYRLKSLTPIANNTNGGENDE